MQEIEGIDGAKEFISLHQQESILRDSVILQFFCPKGTTSKTHWFRRLEEKKEKTAFSVWLCTRNKADHSRDFVTSGGPVTEISSLSQKTSLHGKKQRFKMEILIHFHDFSGSKRTFYQRGTRL